MGTGRVHFFHVIDNRCEAIAVAAILQYSMAKRILQGRHLVSDLCLMVLQKAMFNNKQIM